MTNENWTVYKYPLDAVAPDRRDLIRLTLPVGAKPLSVGYDPKVGMCLWAQIPLDASQLGMSDFALLVKGTGHTIRDEDVLLPFIGTVIMPTGFVFHFWWAVNG